MSLLRSLIAWFFFQQSSRKFDALLEKTGHRKLYIFDIDNTLADTWPCYYIPFPTYAQRLLSLPAFMGMRKVIKQVQDAGYPYLFITARNRSAAPATISWLNSIGLQATADTVIIVSNAAQKITLIKKALQQQIGIEYYDDLSYNHENGEVKLYEAAIRQISGLPVVYYSKEKIDQINQHNH